MRWAVAVTVATVVGAGIPVQAQDPLVFDTIRVGWTTHDNPYYYQTYRQIAVDPTGRVHLIWNDPSPMAVRYNSWFGGQMAYSDTGCIWNSGADGYIARQMDLALDDTLPVFVNQEELPAVPLNPVLHRWEGDCLWSAFAQTVPFDTYRKPNVAVHRQGEDVVYHVVATAPVFPGLPGLVGGRIGYWRSTTLGEETFRVVDSNTWGGDHPNAQVVASPVSDRVAIAYLSLPGGLDRPNALFFYESLDGGVSWGGGDGFGARDSTLDVGVSMQSWSGLTLAYDYDDSLHFAFFDSAEDEIGETVRLYHWSRATGKTPIAYALWECSGVPLYYGNINHFQLAVGAGEQRNNLYVIWEQVGNPTCDADQSARGILNSEVYLAISADGGVTWDGGRNITNSLSPGCDGNCFSETFPTIAPVVDSFVHVLYQMDLESGNDTWDHTPTTTNPYYYLRLATPDPSPRPLMVGLSDPLHWFSPYEGESDSVVLTIANEGVADLEFTLSSSVPWLSFAGGSDTHADVVVPGAETTVLLVADAAGLAQGPYLTELLVASNDPYCVYPVDVRLLVTSDTATVLDFFGETSGVRRGTDGWGWTAPDGIEYALMGLYDGIICVNVDTRRIVDHVPAAEIWIRDMKTYGHYCYAVSEAGDGMRIIDLQYLPDSLHLVGIFMGLVPNAHNISIDTANGFAYMAGRPPIGFRVISLADPEAPVEYPPVYTDYAHNLTARNDTVWYGETTYLYSVWDVADKYSPQLITKFGPLDGEATHSIWPSPRVPIVATTEETAGRTIKIWDISNLPTVELLSEYLCPEGTPHDVYIVGDFLYTSNYEAGMRVVDISDPSQPVQVAAVDTWPVGDGGEWYGCWGVYPLAQNGLTYAFNTDGKLFLIDVTDSLPDQDGDRIADANDNCLLTPNPNQVDSDTDGMGDSCDVCPYHPGNDADGDGVCEDIDNCPYFPNPDQVGCPHHGDPVADGFTDVLDVVSVVNVAFRGGPPFIDPGCPHDPGGRTDVNCDGVTDVLDVVMFVNVAFRAAPPDFCAPCACDPYPSGCP